MNDEVLVAIKAGVAGLFGSALALRWLPGTRSQRALSFIGSLGIGWLAGWVAVERYGILAGSPTHQLATAAAAVFGLSIVNSAMQQIPEILASVRRRITGS